ncbi:L-rhamnose isomerase [Candidatus Fermentibacteria bacterium]|nr:L-rhamnose isomerase [Candidatus Fermentibacteria bacterium]
MSPEDRIEAAYRMAAETYSRLGVDTNRALERLAGIAISLNCWQGDDVRGFEAGEDALAGSGLECTGDYPGRARNAIELRSDLRKALSLVPGGHRVNLHAMYAETAGGREERNRLRPEHFSGWMDWAAEHGLALDFNPTFFAHPMSVSGFTLSSIDPEIRGYWIEHGRACRKIAAEMGRRQGRPCVNNLWIPDGFKDTPVDRAGARRRLRDSLDRIYDQDIDHSLLLDSLESKLFGIGSESCVVGSHEFYLGYAMARGKMICLDTGHFHPTERVSDKISSVLEFADGLLLHLSRPVRWDSDHVPVLDDELTACAREVVRCDRSGDRVSLAMDFFDATINRVAAWVIGSRSVLRAFLLALLEPTEQLVKLEKEADYTGRLALAEELKNMPFGAVWDHYCLRSGVPTGMGWMEEVRRYEREVLRNRT